MDIFGKSFNIFGYYLDSLHIHMEYVYKTFTEKNAVISPNFLL